MAAAYPFVDDFLPIHNLASLERLGEVLGGLGLGAAGRPPRTGVPHVYRVEAAGSGRRSITAVAPRVFGLPSRAGAGRTGGRPGGWREPLAAAITREDAPMKELLDRSGAWQAEGAELGRAVVVRTFGSAPRPEGASLVVRGGRTARRVRLAAAASRAPPSRRSGAPARDGVSRVIRYGISDEQAWDVGLACGGTIDVLVEPFAPAGGARGGRRAPGGVAVVIPLPADAPPAGVRAARAGAGRAAGARDDRGRGRDD